MSEQTRDAKPSLPDRRTLLTLAAGTALALESQSVLKAQPPAALPAKPTALHIKPRYHRWHVNPGVEWIETNTEYATLDWTIPLSQAGLILVDCWDHHYLKDTEARAERIIQEKMVPLLKGCRDAGMTIVHAPSPPHATRHPNWVNAGKPVSRSGAASDWPPAEFRSKSGAFKAYRRPAEPREPELAKLRAGLKIHPNLQPVGAEPVVATGDELHQYCKQAGIMFLFFAGFNTNACILVRDYGTLEMSKRGYEVILLRDCTTGMESRRSHPTLSQTEGAVLFLEMFGQYSLTSDEIRTGFRST